jgi:alpha-L-arabinofuranosidase
MFSRKRSIYYILLAVLLVAFSCRGAGTLKVNLQGNQYPISPLLYGNNIHFFPEEYKDAPMGPIRDLGITILRYPGGGMGNFFDWTHPTETPWHTGVPSWGEIYGVMDTDEFVEFTRNAGIGDKMITVNCTRQDPVMNIQYLGNASEASLTISGKKLTVTLTGDQTDNSKNLNIDLLAPEFDTLGKVASYIASQPGYSASLIVKWRVRDNEPSQPLVEVSQVNIKDTPVELFVRIGTPELAAQWVRYCNITNNYNVKYWELGNELYAPYLKNAEEYAQTVREFATAMKAVDPTIKIGAVVVDPLIGWKSDTWNQILAEQAGQYIDFIIPHVYSYSNFDEQGKPHIPAILALPVFYDRYQAIPYLRGIFQQATGSTNIPVFVTEYNQEYYTPETLMSLVNSLFIADFLGVFMKNRVNGANYWVISGDRFGAFSNMMKSEKYPSYYALYLYRHHFGEIYVESQLQSPTYNVPKQIGNVLRGDYPYLSAYTSLSKDRSTLYLMVINKNTQGELINIEIEGGKVEPIGKAWEINGNSYAYEDRDTVGIREKNIVLGNSPVNLFAFSAPGHSVTALEFKLSQEETPSEPEPVIEFKVIPQVLRKSNSQSLTIQYHLEEPGNVTTVIYNPEGRIVRELEKGGYKTGGDYEIQWDGLDNKREHVTSGPYIVRTEFIGGNDKKLWTQTLLVLP